jgi:hypothetical protein
MTQQDEEYAMERLKNMPSLASFLEMADELNVKEDVIVKNYKTTENRCSKMSESEQEALVEYSVPFLDEDCNHESTKEHGIHNAGREDVNIESLESGK